MILVDSSAWIEFYRLKGNRGVQEAVARAVETDLVAVNGIIKVEIVSFAPTDAEFRRLSRDFAAFQWLELKEEAFDRATKLGFDLRRKGVTVPPTDLVIAASAILAGATLYHVDAHFDAVAAHSTLEARHLGH